jgi:hypothetical protein
MVPFDEIAGEKNDFNLNLPRYVDASEPEDIEDIEGHLKAASPRGTSTPSPTTGHLEKFALPSGARVKS